MTDLKFYGTFLRSYRGSGRLWFDEIENRPCTFQIVQVTNGRLYAECLLPELELDILRAETVISLKGTTDSAQTVVLDGLMLIENRVTDALGHAQQKIVAFGRDLTLESIGDSPCGPLEMRFALPNMTFVGTERFSIGNGEFQSYGLELPLNLRDFKVTVRPVRDYARIVNELKASRGVNVTCIASLMVAAIGEEKIAIESMNDLCLLLTLARGCRVDWLYYDVVSQEGELLKTYHRNVVTKPFGTLSLIAEMPRDDIVQFVEETFPALQHRRELWEFRKVVDAYTDAKVEGDFLEARGLKMVVTMEALKGRYLIHVAKPDKVHVIPPDVFAQGRERLSLELLSLLGDIFPGATASERELMASHSEGLNWYPFARALKDLCSTLGLQVNSKDRRRFIEVRNALVHNLEFHKDRARLGNAWEQYTFLMTFVGRILLAILGYRGFYYDWTRPPGWVGNSEMRVRLHLG